MTHIIDYQRVDDVLEDIIDYKYVQNKNADKTTYMLYNLLSKGDKYIRRKKQGKCFNYNLTKINMISQIPKPNIYDISFFPDEIQRYIDDNAEHVLEFNCKIKSRNITIRCILCEKLNTDIILTLSNYIHKIYIWIYMLDSLSSTKCSKNLELYLYLTPFKKELPDNQLTILDTKHVNTAFTSGCRENTQIVLYRSEEWFKVFIHETFHNFGLDFSDMNLSSVNKRIKDIFNMNIEYNLYESYCETWARIINTMFFSYFSMPPKERDNQRMFINLFNQNIEVESRHSLYQFTKILSFLELKYNMIIEKNTNNITICNHLYKENTSVFSYYVICGLLMNNYKDFMSWCYKNNNILVQFKKTPLNLERYLDFIQKSSKNNNIKKNIHNIERSFMNGSIDITPTLRMSYLDIEQVFNINYNNVIRKN